LGSEEVELVDLEEKRSEKEVKFKMGKTKSGETAMNQHYRMIG
jgi:hypothetical protein